MNNKSIDEIKKSLKNESLIKLIINIANDNGNTQMKICAIRDELLHGITGFYWDEV